MPPDRRRDMEARRPIVAARCGRPAGYSRPAAGIPKRRAGRRRVGDAAFETFEIERSRRPHEYLLLLPQLKIKPNQFMV
jgi:hypothetical protein